MGGRMVEARWGIGDVVRKLRLLRGWTLEQLAEQAEMPFSVIWKLESGRTKEPRRATLTRLAAAFGLTVRQLEDLVPQGALRYVEIALGSKTATPGGGTAPESFQRSTAPDHPRRKSHHRR